ncbi:MAG TPA: hypothetical protein VKT74_04640, partial [Gammaproteobacteria bacterium]|nr:hypothetical protein [Gammaproteobacteria bacterium]
MSLRPLLLAAGSAVLVLLAAPTFADGPSADTPSEFPPEPFPSTYQPLPSQPTLIRHATVYTGTGAEIDDGDVLLKDGKV